ncbi:MAG: hypothetical protein WD830_11835 [Chloroflexota bacterium]
MLTDYLIPLTAALVGLAAVFALCARFLRRRAKAMAPGMAQLARSIDDMAHTLPVSLSIARVELAEQGAAVEHSMWLLARFGDRVDGATLALAERRQALDATRAKLEGARANVERLKSVVGLIMRAIELRRAILG